MTDKITIDRDFLQQALDALIAATPVQDDDPIMQAKSIVALTEALAAPHPSRQCWKCGDPDPAFQAKCDAPGCGMREALAASTQQAATGRIGRRSRHFHQTTKRIDMTDKILIYRSLLQQALTSLEDADTYVHAADLEPAIDALREALSAPQPALEHEPWDAPAISSTSIVEPQPAQSTLFDANSKSVDATKALDQIYECIYDHGNGKTMGVASIEQRRQAYSNLAKLHKELPTPATLTPSELADRIAAGEQWVVASQRQPLTDEQIDDLLLKYGYDADDEAMREMIKDAYSTGEAK